MTKIYIILIAGLIACSTCFAQNTLPLSGNVGIGTTNPQNSLEVRKDVPGGLGPVLELINGGGGGGSSTELHFGTYNHFGGVPQARVRVVDNAAFGGDFYFDTKGAGPNEPLYNRLFIQGASGNLGIGTNAPNARLRVVGGGTVLGNNSVITTTDGHLSIGDINANSSPTNGDWADKTTLVLNAQDYSAIGFHDSGQRVDFIRAGKGIIQLGYDGGWGQASIGLPGGIWSAAGDLGIGTNDTHGFKLAVNGNIRAREIKVEAGPWPDYVFKPTYKLPSLSAVKEYIDKNQHLPDIPSEAEVAKEGINLGEMNRLLLKKVEELTLYLIDVKQELKDLRRQVNSNHDNKKHK
jgi:hypothetical protein